jgi:8-oxo-dGTP pyrophosphatase MutT (NUDIX family)
MKDRKDCASGILPICSSTKQICLAWRSTEVKEGDRWGCIGGMMKESLSPQDSALTELLEEVGYSGPIELVPAFLHVRKGFVYHNFLGIVPEPFLYDPLPEFAWETTHIEWMSYDHAQKLVASTPKSFHRGVVELFDKSHDLILKYA